MESKRQSQVNRIIQENLSAFFLKSGTEFYGKSLVTITEVRTSPDLSIAKIYTSIYNTDKPNEVLAHLNNETKKIRGRLGNQIRNRVRIIPELHFYIDDTLDHVFKMEELFDKIKKEES